MNRGFPQYEGYFNFIVFFTASDMMGNVYTNLKEADHSSALSCRRILKLKRRWIEVLTDFPLNLLRNECYFRK